MTRAVTDPARARLPRAKGQIVPGCSECGPLALQSRERLESALHKTPFWFLLALPGSFPFWPSGKFSKCQVGHNRGHRTYTTAPTPLASREDSCTTISRERMAATSSRPRDHQSHELMRSKGQQTPAFSWRCLSCRVVRFLSRDTITQSYSNEPGWIATWHLSPAHQLTSNIHSQT